MLRANISKSLCKSFGIGKYLKGNQFKNKSKKKLHNWPKRIIYIFESSKSSNKIKKCARLWRSIEYW